MNNSESPLFARNINVREFKKALIGLSSSGEADEYHLYVEIKLVGIINNNLSSNQI